MLIMFVAIIYVMMGINAGNQFTGKRLPIGWPLIKVCLRILININSSFSQVSEGSNKSGRKSLLMNFELNISLDETLIKKKNLQQRKN